MLDRANYTFPRRSAKPLLHGVQLSTSVVGCWATRWRSSLYLACLQFKLLNGATMRGSFDPGATLQEVYHFIDTNRTGESRPSCPDTLQVLTSSRPIFAEAELLFCELKQR